MFETKELIEMAQYGNTIAEVELLRRYEPLINKYSRRFGLLDEDCKQHLAIEFLLATRKFDINRYL
ncbi:helix-turn-helix domain-containing protein [Paenibacillus tritici]|uniref:helix-turn-helix domain-containing protein n=1 Tax=Paenibacillus tritici TaxID=1873425 RepID=UPI001BA9A522|nr:helix-turn-helix domain-containing protein [Paenibacillus tritici]QUL53516.1 helix-turn-helix domain-containing protein [Paenibacillus tritici]